MDPTTRHAGESGIAGIRLSRDSGATCGPQALGGIACLSHLGEARRRELLDGLQKSRHPRGAVLFQAGDQQAAMLIVLEGTVKLYCSSEDGHEQALWLLGPGECFCPTPEMKQGGHAVSALCLTPVRALRLPRESWERLYRREPEMARAVVACLGRRLTDLAQRVGAGGPRDAQRRLAYILVELAKRQGRRVAGGLVLEPGLSHEQLAACAGTAREVVSRHLANWEKRGWVRRRRRGLLIRELGQLRDLIA